MTQDEIIEMAFKAGVEDSNEYDHLVCTAVELIAFAKLVTEKEREACAKIADEWAVGWPHPSQVIAERIREKGQ